MAEKGMSLEECVKEARKLISKHRVCLLLFDVKGSKTFEDRSRLNSRLNEMMIDLNQKFGEYFPENDLAVYSRKEKGFAYLLGDGSWAGINSEKAIPEIIEYQKKNYPDISLYWGVAMDGFDKERTKIVR